MVPLACDNRLTRQTLEGILHGVVQGGVKAPDAGFRRGEAPALRRHLQPGQPAGDPATFGRVQCRHGRSRREGRLTQANVSALEPEGERALGEAVSWAE